ncbi:MAG: RsiV family protein [Duncaniella sp.]|nr:RsiV family protein [Duncaniella sp.]
MKDYYGITSRPRKVDGIDASRRTPEEIATHFAKVHERLYRKEFGRDTFPPKYDYMMEVTPVWQSADSSLITYRFYTYTYTMGLHGYPEEYFLTFDNHTGRLLGWKDLMDEAEMSKCLADLSQRMTAYKEETFGRKLDEPFPAYLTEEDISSNSTELLKESFDGLLYPRPALTRKGLLFSYQPYEAGCFAEGTLHFAVPYDKICLKYAP